MSRIKWDEVGKRFFETGVDRVVLYPAYTTQPQNETNPYDKGVAWNGVTAISESASGGEPSPLWADNIKYLNLISAEEASLSIEAYTYPDEFEECDGTRGLASGLMKIRQQSRKQFALTYRTRIGNDQQSDDYGYKLHFVYGCYASPSDRSYATVNDSPEAISFSWGITTTPVEVPGSYKPTAIITVSSTDFDTNDQSKLTNLENMMYGTDVNGNVAATDPKMPMPADIQRILTATQ